MSQAFLLPTGIRTDAFFDDMPSEVREFLKYGFSKLATLPKPTLEEIASQVNRWIDPVEPQPAIDTIAARDFEVGLQDMTAIMSAVSLLTSARFEDLSPIPFETFVTNATDSGILNASNVEAIQAFGDFLNIHRSALSVALARASSSTHVLPSFQHLSTAIGLRVVAVSDERVVTMPVVMATLRTDVEGQELLFQMTPRELGQLLQQLQELSEQLPRYKDATTRPAPRN